MMLLDDQIKTLLEALSTNPANAPLYRAVIKSLHELRKRRDENPKCDFHFWRREGVTAYFCMACHAIHHFEILEG